MTIAAQQKTGGETRPRRVHYPSSDGKPLGETDKHRNVIFYVIEALKTFFADRTGDVYVSGDNFIYYEEGNPRARVSPDAYVVFGVPMRERDSYFTWREDGRRPAVVFEITSRSTKNEDVVTKFERYERVLQVPEYFLFDPTGDYLRPRLQGYRLGPDGRYARLELTENGLHSAQLNLDLLIEGERLRLFDTQKGEPLPTPAELATRAQAEAANAQTQTARANAEADARARAEAEIARLRAELDALRPGSAPSEN